MIDVIKQRSAWSRTKLIYIKHKIYVSLNVMFEVD